VWGTSIKALYKSTSFTFTFCSNIWHFWALKWGSAQRKRHYVVKWVSSDSGVSFFMHKCRYIWCDAQWCGAFVRVKDRLEDSMWTWNEQIHGMWYFYFSVLWHCWLGNQKSIRPVKSRVLVCWWWLCDGAWHILLLQLSPPLPSSLAPVKSRMETFLYWLTQVVVEKGR